MIFPTNVNGIPCQCSVLHYHPATPARISGPPELCHSGEPEELEFEILDRMGYRASWLDRYLNEATKERLAEEAHVMFQAEERERYYDYDFT